MSWNLEANLQSWNELGATDIPVRFFLVEGGLKRGFMANQVLHNNLEVLLEFQDAVQYNNIIVGRQKDAFSGDIAKLSAEGKIQNGLRLIARVIREDKRETYHLSLYMYGIKIYSMGRSTIGALGEIEKFKFLFDKGVVNIGNSYVKK